MFFNFVIEDFNLLSQILIQGLKSFDFGFLFDDKFFVLFKLVLIFLFISLKFGNFVISHGFISS